MPAESFTGRCTGTGRCSAPVAAGSGSVGDRGSGTIWVLSLVGLVMVAGTFALALGQAAMARHRAGSAADLAALAAADHALDGRRSACARAAAVALAQRARVVACAINGEIADVWVEVRIAAPLATLPPARVRARAGPGPGGSARSL